MFPYRDLNRTTNVPYLTYMLILINISVFVYMQSLGDQERFEFIVEWGAIPNLIVNGLRLETVFSSMFIHAGWAHIISNMLFLYVFGDNVEAKLGRFKFLLFYFIGGLAAFAGQAITDLNSIGPMVGASGAIGAVLGGYLVFFPNSAIQSIFIIGGPGVTSAKTWIMYWFLWQVIFGVGTIGSEGGIAFFAHIGGFAAGWAMAKGYDRYLGGDNFNTGFRQKRPY